MALKIRCDDCKKKISIDEAFAGGMCRCPYCKAIVAVPGGEAAPAKRSKTTVQRRGAPMRPDRPGGPTAAAPPAAAPAPVEPEPIPMATPVKVQGIVTIVLLVGLLGMVGAGIAMAIVYVGGKQEPEQPTPVPVNGKGDEPVNPLAPTPRSSIAGIAVEGPVIYILDTSKSMYTEGGLDYANIILVHAIDSMPQGSRCAIYLAGESEDRFVDLEGGAYFSGGPISAERAGRALRRVIGAGISDRDAAIEKVIAMDPGPKTIVLLTRDAVDDPASLAEQAAQKKIRVIVIALNAPAGAAERLEGLTDPTGGKTVSYTVAGLRAFRKQPNTKIPEVLQ